MSQRGIGLRKILASNIRDDLKAGQEVVYSIVITETGIAANKLVLSDEVMALFGITAGEE